MKKHFIFLITVITLCGCFPSGMSGDKDTDYESVLREASKIENFTLDLDLPDETRETFPAIYAELKEWDPNVLRAVFLENKVDEHYEYAGNDFPEESRYADLTEKNILCYEHGNISYSTYKEGSNQELVSQHLVCSFVRQDCDTAGLKDDLSLFTMDEALLRCEALLTKLGISNIGEPTVYSVTKEYAAKVADLDWQDGDEVYYIEYPIRYNDIDVNQYDITILGTDYFSSTECRISMIIAFNKILEFECNHYADFYMVSEESDRILTSQEAVSVLVNHFSSVKNLEKNEFHSIRLVYVPVDVNGIGFIYEPAWLFEGIKTLTIDNDEFKEKTYELIYAKTGIRYAYYG